MSDPVMVRVTVSGVVERDRMDYDQLTPESFTAPFDLKVPGFKLVRWESSILELAAERDELVEFLDGLGIDSMESFRDAVQDEMGDLQDALDAFDFRRVVK